MYRVKSCEFYFSTLHICRASQEKGKKKKPKGTTTLGFTHNLTKFGKWCRGEETKEKGSGRPEVVNCEKVSFSWKLKGQFSKICEFPEVLLLLRSGESRVHLSIPHATTHFLWVRERPPPQQSVLLLSRAALHPNVHILQNRRHLPVRPRKPRTFCITLTVPEAVGFLKSSPVDWKRSHIGPRDSSDRQYLEPLKNTMS